MTHLLAILTGFAIGLFAGWRVGYRDGKCVTHYDVWDKGYCDGRRTQWRRMVSMLNNDEPRESNNAE